MGIEPEAAPMIVHLLRDLDLKLSVTCLAIFENSWWQIFLQKLYNLFGDFMEHIEIHSLKTKNF